MEKSRPRLPAHEWAAVLIFMLILAFLAIMNLVVNKREAQLALPTIPVDEIFITLEGAVAAPKTLKVKKGTKLEELIEKVGVLPNTDLSLLTLKQSLKNDQIIVVPKKKMLVVFLEGEVSPKGAYEIEAGSSLKDLYRKLGKKPTKENRKLKAEEVIKF